jgi:hypothetical protein
MFEEPDGYAEALWEELINKKGIVMNDQVVTQANVVEADGQIVESVTVTAGEAGIVNGQDPNIVSGDGGVDPAPKEDTEAKA